MGKLISGRFWFTVVTAIVFLGSSMSGLLNSEQILSVIMLVIGFYFNRTDRQPKNTEGTK